MLQPGVDFVDQILGGVRDHRAGRVDRLSTCLVERIIVLRRYESLEVLRFIWRPTFSHR